MTNRDDMATRYSSRHFLAGGLLIALSFTLTWWIGRRLYAMQVLSQYDAWFETDPNYYMTVFTKGPFWFYIRHPILAELGHAPVAVLAKLLNAVGIVGESPEALRDQLALLLVPASAAVRTLAFFSLFLRLLRRLLPAALLCVIDIFAATTVTVCAVPDSYAFTASSLAVAFWLALDDAPRRWWVRATAWVLVAAVAIGVTLSNAVPIALLATAWLVRHGYGWVKAMPWVAAVIAGALLVDTAVVLVGAWTFGYPLAMTVTAFAARFTHEPSWTIAAGIAWALGHTFLAPLPGTEPAWMKAPYFDFMFSYAPPYVHGWASVWRAGITAVMLAFGAAGLLQRPALRVMPLIVLAIVAANVAVHLYYGVHFNLYAGHWQAALLVVMAGTAMLPGRVAAAGIAALSCYALLTIASSAALLDYVFEYLAAHRISGS